MSEDYISNLESLNKRHPDTNFVAVTVPLIAIQTGPKAWIKRLLGKKPSGYLDNARRMEFNNLLRERYHSAGRLFDLARVESQSSGKSCLVHVDGQEIEVLCPELKGDGNHLNERGQVLAASAFLSFVNSLPVK